MSKNISPSEKNFIIEGISAGIRSDGRSAMDQRQMYLEVGLYPQASGSCKVSIGGGTAVLAGVRAAVGEPISTSNDPSSLADKGRVNVSITCSPSLRIYHDKRQLDDLATSYAQFLSRTLNGSHGGLDLKNLCIIPNLSCWVLNVDVLIMDYGGNLLDAIFAAVRGALFDTRLPKCVVETIDGAADFRIDGDEETEVLVGRESIPLSQTVSRIGNGQVIDCSVQEEQCTTSRVTVLTNEKRMLCGMQKDLHGVLDASILVEMVEIAQKIAMENLDSMKSLLKKEEQRQLQFIESVGFRL